MNKIKWKYISFTAIGIIVAIVAAYLLNEQLALNNARQEIVNVKNQAGTITAYNDEMLLFTTGQKIENTNISQKALGKNGKVTNPASFIFSNGKSNKNKKTVRAYLDFSEQRSRDFILMNQTLLKSMIQAGTIDLQIFAVPTGKAFSYLSSEALAEAFVTEPKQSWNFFVDLMKASAELESNKNAEDMVKRIVELAEKNKITQIDKNSLYNGTFSSWLLTVANDPFLQPGVLLPEVFVGNTALVDIINVNDSDQLRKAITGRGE